MTSLPPSPPSRSGKLLAHLNGPWGAALLATFAVLEATVFPAPTEAALIALVIARREHAWRLVLLATAASLVGALLAYAMADAWYPTLAEPILRRAGLLDRAGAVMDVYQSNAFLALATSAYTPIPYMLYTMMAGAADVPMLTFVAGAAVGRALKFLPLAAGAYFAGPAIYALARRVGWWVVAAVTAGLIIAVIVAS